jgi:hypothetical protein
MGVIMNWSEIWNRFNFFNAQKENNLPDSITAPIDEPRPEDYDINFENEIRRMTDGEPGVIGSFGSLNYISWLSMIEKSKDDRTLLYREMEQNSHVSEALDEIVFAGLNEDKDGNVINLILKGENVSISENIRDNLNREFKHIIDNILQYKNNFYTWFHEFVIMGECALEILIDNNDALLRKNGVRGVNLLISEQYIPYHTSSGDVNGFVIKNLWNRVVRVVAEREQIAYADSGKYDFVSGLGPTWAKQYLPTRGEVVRLVRSFIDSARKPYKQLDALEDSLVIYRLARAPERLIFNVATGNLPKNKAEQYLQKLINKYRKKSTYNPQTGYVDQAQNVKNIMEDFWFVKDQQGKGTEVTTIQSGANLGEIEDVNFFVKKLYKAMRVPWNRYTGDAAQAPAQGMSKDDIKFEAFVYTMVRKFSEVVRQIFKQHLKMKGIWQHYEMKDSDFDIVPVPPSYFQYMKNNELMETQFTRFQAFANNLNTEKPVFSKKMALKDGLGWDDAKIAQNEKWLKEELGEVVPETTPEGPMGGAEPGGQEGGAGGEPKLDLGPPDNKEAASEIEI